MRSLTTRLLHFALAASVIHQLLVSLIMHGPRPGRDSADLAFQLHETVGLGSLGVIGAFRLWSLLRELWPKLGDGLIGQAAALG